ncbi:MAG: hypothetical protein E7617_05305 [Ruminococcaceae bacterium]|nr:hypothetical protein [Oscillospiraceae bacterium]
MNRQELLDKQGVYCKNCNAPKKLVQKSCTDKSVLYHCPFCNTTYELSVDKIELFAEYRREMQNKFKRLTRGGSLNKPKEDLQQELDEFGKYHPDFTNADPQYHLFCIAAATDNFRIKYRRDDSFCQEIEDYYKTAVNKEDEKDEKNSKSFPIDTYGKILNQRYLRWINPVIPLREKIAIGVSIAIVTLAVIITLLIAANKGVNIEVPPPEGGAADVIVSIDTSDFGIIGKWFVKPVVNRLGEGTAEYNAATALLRNESKKYKVYDITMLRGNDIVQPKSPVKVTILIPQNFLVRNTVVYYITPEGKCQIIKNATIVEVDERRTISFETDHFSLYAIAERPFHVNFLPENGQETFEQKVMWGGVATEPEAPKREGYTFGGWYNGQTKWNFKTNIVGDDVTLKAVWTPNEYTISFDSNGGSAADTIPVVYDESYALPTISRVGYEFLGWYDTEDNRYQDGKWTLTENLALTAKWEPVSNSVNLNVNGGNTIENDTLTFTYDSPYGTLPTPLRKGYTFLGWFTAESGGEKVTDTTVVKQTESHTLFAHWKVNTYEVTFDVNGGDAMDNNVKEVTFGESFGRLPAPTRTGYTFLGWFTAKQNGEKILAETTVDITADVRLYALWSSNGYTVTFMPQGGSLTTESIGVEFGSEYGNIPSITRTGYTFLGWFTAENGGTKIGSDDVVSVAKDHTLYAQWEANKYTVNLDVNGGEALNNNSKEVVFAESFGDLPTPVRTGYTFVGWFTAKSEGKEILPETNVDITANITLYALWSVNGYTVTLDATGGAVSPGYIPVIFDAEYGTLPEPQKYGHEFLGWFTESEGGTEVKATTVVKTDSAHTLYAQWKKGVYIITLDPDGGQCDTAFIEREYSSLYGELPVPVKTGYTFTGWFTERDGGNKISADSVMNKEAHTLYAHWSVNRYTVKFILNGEEYAIESYDFGEAINYPTINIPGHTFSGWKWGIKELPQSMPAGDIEISGSTEINTYSINYYLDGKLYKTVSCKYGESISLIDEPTEAGSVFSGWKYSGSEDKIPATMPADDIRIDGSFDKMEFKVYYFVDGVLEKVSNVIYGHGIVPYEHKKEGYTFSGWLVKDGDITTHMPDVMPEKDLYAYGTTTINQYTITFDTNGGTIINSITADYGAKITAPTAPSKLGHEFIGWDNSIPANMPAYDMTITAEWEKLNEYKISFIVNNPNSDKEPAGEMESIEGYYKEQAEVALTENAYVVDGWIFKGWSTAEKGGVVYEDRATFHITEPSDKNEISLYAVWEVDIFTVGKFVDTGSVVSDSWEGGDTYTVFNTVESTPRSATSITKTIIDWSRIGNTDIASYNIPDHVGRVDHIDFSSGTNEIVFVGDASKTYKNLGLCLCNFTEKHSPLIRFINFKLESRYEKVLDLYNSKNVNLTIESYGRCSIMTTCESGSVIDGIKTLTFNGPGELILNGGTGRNGNGGNCADNNGYNGAPGDEGGVGGTAIKAEVVYVRGGTLKAIGGTGGRGGSGGCCNPYWVNIVYGGNGGNGGAGGLAISASKVIIDGGSLTATGGKGGQGGTAGGVYDGFDGTQNGRNGSPGEGGYGGNAVNESCVIQGNGIFIFGSKGDAGSGIDCTEH